MEKGANDEKFELEEQFILRLPKEEANYVRSLLRDKPKKLKKSLKLELDEKHRQGVVHVKKKALPATLVDLPTIVESSKTVNGVNVYKTGTISQMLLCDDTEKTPSKKNLYPHGLAPPMKNVRRQRFRKSVRNDDDVREAADVQKELMLLLRTDYDAVAFRYEVLVVNNNNNSNTEEQVTERMLFGAISDSEDSSTSHYDIMEFNN